MTLRPATLGEGALPEEPHESSLSDDDLLLERDRFLVFMDGEGEGARERDGERLLFFDEAGIETSFILVSPSLSMKPIEDRSTCLPTTC